MFLWYFFYLIVIIYVSLIILALSGWIKLPKFKKDNSNQDYIFISIVIAVRNEEMNLSVLVSNLKKLNYPKSKYEVIFVNDHSDDKSLQILKRISKQDTIFKVYSLTDNLYGKKNAIKKGISEAKGELCVLTDADCLINPEWLDLYSSFYNTFKKPSLIIGLVDYASTNKILENIFRLEFLSLVITGAGFAAHHLPLYCNGANLAVKRKDFLNINILKNEFASGDDVFLLHAFKKHNKQIKIIKSFENVVYTKAPSGLSDFLNQRIRWGSKVKAYNDITSIILATIVFLISLCLIIALVLGLYIGSFKFFIWGFLAKLSTDILLFISGSRFFKISKHLYLVPFLEVVYPFYIVYTALKGIKKPFEWKGRIEM